MAVAFPDLAMETERLAEEVAFMAIDVPVNVFSGADDGMLSVIT